MKFSKVTVAHVLFHVALVGWAITPHLATAAVLVYDDNSVHHFASTAALALDPTRVVANSGNFNSLLTSQSWAAVLVDSPSNIPTGGWLPTINFVNGGGHVAMSFRGKGIPACSPHSASRRRIRSQSPVAH
jgi:hypothetical protein